MAGLDPFSDPHRTGRYTGIKAAHMLNQGGMVAHPQVMKMAGYTTRDAEAATELYSMEDFENKWRNSISDLSEYYGFMDHTRETPQYLKDRLSASEVTDALRNGKPVKVYARIPNMYERKSAHSPYRDSVVPIEYSVAIGDGSVNPGNLVSEITPQDALELVNEELTHKLQDWKKAIQSKSQEEIYESMLMTMGIEYGTKDNPILDEGVAGRLTASTQAPAWAKVRVGNSVQIIPLAKWGARANFSNGDLEAIISPAVLTKIDIAENESISLNVGVDPLNLEDFGASVNYSFGD